MHYRVYTVDGEVLFKVQDGKTSIYELEVEEFASDDSPATVNDIKMLEGRMRVINSLYSLMEEVKSLGRKVPVTREELSSKFGVTKKMIRAAEADGLICFRIIPVVQTVDKKNVGSKAVVYLTPKGRGYVRFFIDKTYLTQGIPAYLKEQAETTHTMKQGEACQP